MPESSLDRVVVNFSSLASAIVRLENAWCRAPGEKAKVLRGSAGVL